MLSELWLSPRARDDGPDSWTLETDAGRVTAVLDRHDDELRLFHFFAYADDFVATTEGYGELLEINAGTDGAHYCLLELEGRRYLALRALVCPEALELPAVALVLESLLRQARQTLPEEGAPEPSGPFALGDQVAARGGVLPPGGVEAALREGAVAVGGALAELELEWWTEPGELHDWRIPTDLGDLQVFLRPEGTSVVVPLPPRAVDRRGGGAALRALRGEERRGERLLRADRCRHRRAVGVGPGGRKRSDDSTGSSRLRPPSRPHSDALLDRGVSLCLGNLSWRTRSPTRGVPAALNPSTSGAF